MFYKFGIDGPLLLLFDSFLMYFFNDFFNSANIKGPLVNAGPPPCWIGLLQPIKQRFAAYCCSNAGVSPCNNHKSWFPLEQTHLACVTNPFNQAAALCLFPFLKPAGWGCIKPLLFDKWMGYCGWVSVSTSLCPGQKQKLSSFLFMQINLLQRSVLKNETKCWTVVNA